MAIICDWKIKNKNGEIKNKNIGRFPPTAFAWVLTLIFSTIFIGCSGHNEKTEDTLAVSFEPQAWLLRQIAGDDFNIVTLLPSGTDPENYQPSMSTLKAIGDAGAYFTLGTEGFESNLKKTLASNFPDLPIYDAAEGVDKIYGTHGDEHGFDPHLLASVRNSIKIADSMTAKLIAIYPDRAEKYRLRNDSLSARLQALDDSISAMRLNGKAFAIRHPSLTYFARDYGLRQIALEEDGKEPTPAQLAERVAAVIGNHAGILAIDKEHASDTDRALAKSIGISTFDVALNSEHWLDDLMRLSKALSD